MWKLTENWLRKLMHNFLLHSNESACRKKWTSWYGTRLLHHHWYPLKNVQNWRLQVNQQSFFWGNKELTSFSCTCSSCDPSTYTETRYLFSTSLLLITYLLLLFISLDLIFLLFLIYSLIPFEEIWGNMEDGSILYDVCR